jgi:hypothetical protein
LGVVNAGLIAKKRTCLGLDFLVKPVGEVNLVLLFYSIAVG